MVRLKLKFLMPFILIVLLIFSTIQYRQNLLLKGYIGMSISETVNYLDNEMYNLQNHLSDFDNNHQSPENITYTLNYFANRLSEIEIEFFNIPSKLPMRKNYYGYLYGALISDLNHIMNINNGINANTWIDKEYIQTRIDDTCKKIRWSYNVIKENSENHKGNYGYFKEIYNLDSKTHNTIDDELERYLRDAYHINIS